MIRTFGLYPRVSGGVDPAGLPLTCPDDLFGLSSERVTWWGPDTATSALWMELARLCVALGMRVNVLGSPDSTESDGHGGYVHCPGVPEVIGLTLGSGKRRCVLLRMSVLGGLSPELAQEERVSSASGLGAKLARAELGNELLPAFLPEASTLCSWSGPMMVYRGFSAMATKWDQRNAYLASWSQPLPARDARWTWSSYPGGRTWTGDDARSVLHGDATGFAVAEVEQPGFYPAWPAAVAGDLARVPLQGVSVVAAPLYVLALLEGTGALSVRRLFRVVQCRADAAMGDRIKARYAGLPKSVYQRTHAALTPCPRLSAKLKPSGELVWSSYTPSARAGRPDVAALLRSFVAAKTAAYINVLPAGHVLASHIDSVHEDLSELYRGKAIHLIASALEGQRERGAAVLQARLAQRYMGLLGRPVKLTHPLGAFPEPGQRAEPGQWNLEQTAPMRCYAPGRWEHGTSRPAMGGQSTTSDPLFLRARSWTADPRTDASATSAPRVAADGGWYSYAWPAGDGPVEGEHG